MHHRMSSLAQCVETDISKSFTLNVVNLIQRNVLQQRKAESERTERVEHE